MMHDFGFNIVLSEHGEFLPQKILFSRTLRLAGEHVNYCIESCTTGVVEMNVCVCAVEQQAQPPKHMNQRHGMQDIALISVFLDTRVGARARADNAKSTKKSLHCLFCV